MSSILCHIVLGGMACFSATLSMDDVDAAPGEDGLSAVVSLDSAAGDSVSGVQFDIAFDGGAMDVSAVTIGQAAAAADKELSFYRVDADTVRVIVAGLNQTAIADGTVAKASFDVDAGAAPGTYAISLMLVLLSDPYGAPVDVEIFPGSMVVTEAEGEGEAEGEDNTGCSAASVTGPRGGLPPMPGCGDMLIVTLMTAVILLAGRRCLDCGRKRGCAG